MNAIRKFEHFFMLHEDYADEGILLSDRLWMYGGCAVVLFLILFVGVNIYG